MTTRKEKLELAKSTEEVEERERILKELELEAESLAKRGELEDSYSLYNELGRVYRSLFMAKECYTAMEQATLMLVRMPSTPERHKKIVEINLFAAKAAEEATEYKKAADFYFRAADFTSNEKEKNGIIILAADALENLADTYELNEQYGAAVETLKKVGRLYYTAGDDELGGRIYERASKVAMKWAEIEKERENFLDSGNAIAEAAQIYQLMGDTPEATRLMMEAGDRYEFAGLHEKAGNIYDAAHESFKLQRLTSATRQAMSKAAESYLKMEGKPEVFAPLLVKAGEMFTEIGRPMKAKWAFKKGSDLFLELAQKSSEEGDIESEKKYIRYQAMCLRKWGDDVEADELINTLVQYYTERAAEEAENNDKAAQAVSLEEIADIFEEIGKSKEAKDHLKQALSLYVELAEENKDTEQYEDASKYYSKAADESKRIGNHDDFFEYHRIASEMAVNAAKFYAKLNVKELATIWTRTAAIEALSTKQDVLTELGIALLRKSTKGFLEIKELKEAFEDFYIIFITTFERNPNDRTTLEEILEKLDSLAKKLQDEYATNLVSILHPMIKGNFTAAILAVQEHEEALEEKYDLLHRLIAEQIPRSGIKVSKRYGIR